MPNFSPDGNTVVFTSEDGTDRDIFTIAIDADGDPLGPATNISNETGGYPVGVEKNPEFSPDGTKIAYYSDVFGNQDIFVIDVATGARTKITSGTESEHDPTWSPDGTKLAYVKELPGNPEIFVINASAGATGTNISNNPGEEYNPDWSRVLPASLARAANTSPLASSIAVVWLGIPLVGFSVFAGRRRRRRSQ